MKAYITRCDTQDGSYSRNLTIERPTTGTGAEYAAEMLMKLGDGHPRMVGRNFRIEACEVDHDPHEVDTGLKIFDSQANRSGGFFTGNASTNTQSSSFLRPYSEVECNGQSFAPGELRAFDLLSVVDRHSVPDKQAMLRSVHPQSGCTLAEVEFADCAGRVLARLREADLIDRNLIVYKVFHTMTNHLRRTHGWVVTDPEGQLVFTQPVDNSAQSVAILDRAVAAYTHRALTGSVQSLLDVVDGELVQVAPEVADIVRHYGVYSDNYASLIARAGAQASSQQERPRSRG